MSEPKKTRKPGSGGARNGAGRKANPNKKETLTITLAPDLLNWLEPYGRKRSSIIDMALREYRKRQS